MPVAECDNTAGLFCNIRQGGCSNVAGESIDRGLSIKIKSYQMSGPSAATVQCGVAIVELILVNGATFGEKTSKIRPNNIKGVMFATTAGKIIGLSR